MSSFVNNTQFEVVTCCNCGVEFAMTYELQKRKLDRRGSDNPFYCPNGHKQWYSGKSEAEKLRDELARKEELLDSTRQHNQRLQNERAALAKAHNKMRARIANGVCPCCNRTFQNLMQHMRTEHPDFSNAKAVLALRAAFGMTQQAVADEAAVSAAQVSLYERGKHVPKRAEARLDNWVAVHSGSIAP